jgi:hypothetical protein
VIAAVVLAVLTQIGVTCALWTLIPSGVTSPAELKTRLATAVIAGAVAAAAVGIVATVTTAILHVASEFPGSRQVIIDVAHSAGPDARTHAISLPCWINPDDPAWLPALRRVLRAHER